MKVLLTNPITSERGMFAATPNLGLGYLATSLRRNGFEVDIWDGMKKDMTGKKLEERLKRLDYDVVGLQVYTCSVEEAQEALKLVKSLNPEVIRIIGGAHVSGDSENALNQLDADFAFRGEAELGLPKLLKKINGSEECDYKDIHHLIWRENGEIMRNELSPIKDVTALGLPGWDLIDPNEYPNAPIGAFVKSFPLATISCSRGCPHQCTYCANKLIMGRGMRARSKESIIEEIDLLYNKYGVREYQIIDDCFTSKRSLAEGVCNEIINRGWKLNITFPNGVRVDSLDEELLKLLERAGCYSIGMAIESGSQRIVDHMKRRQDLEKVREKVELVARVTRIRMTGFFIMGYPAEEREDILKTIKLAKELPLKRAQFTIWIPVPGSEMTETLKREGKLNIRNLSGVVLNQINYVPEKLTEDELQKLLRRAYLEFYLRPKIIFGLLAEIQSLEHLKNILRRVKRMWKAA
ncbi:MAG: cobalamin B12-binding domain-containing protein [Nitrospirae bacterium]|nr:cobalamin B12-binding domain-containing protein [Nitrospirota bacterium]